MRAAFRASAGSALRPCAASVLLAILLAAASVSAAAQGPPPGWPADAQSTTGPIRPLDAPEGLGTEAISDPYLLTGVPAYLWQHGCGPTAAGMVVGYWDGRGFGDLIPGDASSQTPDVDESIASAGNYNDYCLPLDSSPGPLLPDLSEPPPGDEHPDDCIADFMKTSQSYHSNYYGWSWFSHVAPSFTGYVPLANPAYVATTGNWYWGSSLTWETFCAEIDAGRPLVFLVDTNGDGRTDHFVPAIGYGWEGSQPMYACLNTWDSGTHWFEFAQMRSGQPWGIYGATTLAISSTATWFEDDDPAITYTGVWTQYDHPGASAGHLTYSGEVGARAAFTFYGTGLRAVMVTGPICGKANIYGNGVYLVTVDLYRPYYALTSFAREGLPCDAYTLTIEASGEKNPDSRGYLVAIDGLEVMPCETARGGASAKPSVSSAEEK